MVGGLGAERDLRTFSDAVHILFLIWVLSTCVCQLLKIMKCVLFSMWNYDSMNIYIKSGRKGTVV